MKCKRIFKVAGVLALTVALLVSSAVVSFAATYTTTTKYINQNTIEVTSTASDLAEGDMATYVAYNNDSFTDENAVYIDQATAVKGDDGQVKDVVFSYQTDSDNVKATVKFGGSAKEQEPVEPDKDWWKINVQIGEDTAEVEIPEYDDGYLAREIPVALEAGITVKDVKVNGAAVEAWYVKNGAVVIYSDAITNGADVAIETKAVDEPEVVLAVVKAETGAEANKIIAIAKATCGEYANYGILIGGDATLETAVEWDNATDYSKAVRLPALGMSNNGVFCVEVEDTEIVKGTYKVAAYADETVTDAIEVVVE